MRVLVCGGRDYADESKLQAVLSAIHAHEPISCLIHGDARGADRLGGSWAASQGIPVEKYPADWKRDGRAAGPIRNSRMLREGKPDAVIAFPGGRGTSNMVTQATGVGVKVHVIE